MEKSAIVELLKDFVGKDSQDNLIFPILIATPNAGNRGKTTSLKSLILALSNMNGSNVKYVYGDPELNIKNNTSALGWLSNILQLSDSRQYDLSVVITVNTDSGREIKIGISTHGDEEQKIENFLCTGTGDSILKPDFLNCHVIFSACRTKGHPSYKKLQDICASNHISICNIR